MNRAQESIQHTSDKSGFLQLDNDVTELGAGREVGAPHVVEVRGDVGAVEEAAAVGDAVALVHALVADVRRVRVRAPHAHRLVVAQDLDT